jgi:DNA-binding transcriptional regulator YhcF (GntR family)
MELETVSRIFSRLEREGLILADRGHVTITDLDGLGRLAGQVDPEALR